MKYIISENQYNLLVEQFENFKVDKDSLASSYPSCVGGETSNKKRAEIKKNSSGQYYIEVYIKGLSGYQFYSNGRVKKPDGKMGSYACGGRANKDILIDGVDVAGERWKQEKSKYTTDYEKRELKKATDTLNNLDPHTFLTITQIGTAFIPYIGPFISAGIGLADAGLYYKEGDKTTAGLTAAFSMIPFVGKLALKIPGVKKLGARGMAALATKIAKNSKYFTQSEIEIANAVAKYGKEVQDRLVKMAPKLTSIMREVNLYKANFVKKYGEEKYNDILIEYLYGTNDSKNKAKFLSQLKSVKNPTLQVKQYIGAGSDHKVFLSKVNPNIVFKAEIRPGEVQKWYNTFKKHPDVFAQPSKIVKVKGYDGSLLNAVAIEKLNTAPFYHFWNDLTTVANKLKIIQQYQKERGLETILKNLGNPYNRESWNKIMVAAKKEFPNMSNKIDEFNNIINKLYKISPTPDIRQYNLGYTKDGVLKALDI